MLLKMKTFTSLHSNLIHSLSNISILKGTFLRLLFKNKNVIEDLTKTKSIIAHSFLAVTIVTWHDIITCNKYYLFQGCLLVKSAEALLAALFNFSCQNYSSISGKVAISHKSDHVNACHIVLLAWNADKVIVIIKQRN